ncbi:type IV pilin-like G/H family protein [Microcoleus sp. herbarium7]|uniref:type IV pilin-like G/H family protein n=1 Tax=Microcoleus sp. herbarium7 TaxID=3055435 RepID=UPI002FD0F73F
MTVKKMSANSAPSSKKSRLSVSSLLPRIAIYSAVVAGITASLYDFRLNTIDLSSDGAQSLKAKKNIADLNEQQQAYYVENNKFKNFNNNDLPYIIDQGKEEEDRNYHYNFQISSSIGPVQTLENQRETAQFESTIAIAQPKDDININTGKSYTGAVFAFKEKGSNVIKTISAICESDRENPTYSLIWSHPTFDGKEIHCQPGTTKQLR